MTRATWYLRRNDRQLRYAGRVLAADRPIAISIDPLYAATYAGQVCTLVGANLLARMTPALVLDVPDVMMVNPLPWAGESLRESVLSMVQNADPHASFEKRPAGDKDYRLCFGRGPAENTVHGCGWHAMIGTGKSNIPDSNDANPIGPSFAAIAAAARLFGLDMRVGLGGPFLFNTFDWNHRREAHIPELRENVALGEIWTIGAGSVGSAALYFLTLAVRQFSAVTFDMDVVKVENLDRSPVFTYVDADRGTYKSDAVTSYLRSAGVAQAESVRGPLDQSTRWSSRPPGTPDLVISAANERNVRYVIEQSCPPLQIYGTTGTNWVASVIRHIPLIDACSCCVFPPDAQQARMVCAGGKVPASQPEEAVDAALPFLSFGAGLMAAAEILKSTLPGYPFSPSRTVFSTWPSIDPQFTSFTTPQRNGCTCTERNASVHERMIRGSRYERLSTA